MKILAFCLSYLAVWVRVFTPGGARAVAAENIALCKQLISLSRHIIGFSVHKGYVSGADLCCMFNRVISRKELPKYLSSDHDPLFTYHQWRANLRILEVEEVKSISYTPTSHPFIERLIGTVRRELLDQTLFWNALDLQNKLDSFQRYYNRARGHSGIDRVTPANMAGQGASKVISVDDYRWKNIAVDYLSCQWRLD